jgi:hypothetical protein
MAFRRGSCCANVHQPSKPSQRKGSTSRYSIGPWLLIRIRIAYQYKFLATGILLKQVQKTPYQQAYKILASHWGNRGEKKPVVVKPPAKTHQSLLLLTRLLKFKDKSITNVPFHREAVLSITFALDIVPFLAPQARGALSHMADQFFQKYWRTGLSDKTKGKTFFFVLTSNSAIVPPNVLIS